MKKQATVGVVVVDVKVQVQVKQEPQGRHTGAGGTWARGQLAHTIKGRPTASKSLTEAQGKGTGVSKHGITEKWGHSSSNRVSKRYKVTEQAENSPSGATLTAQHNRSSGSQLPTLKYSPCYKHRDNVKSLINTVQQGIRKDIK